MDDTDCTTFLQWALPRAELHWPGYRKVRRQVCKRLRKRMGELGFADFAAYRVRLEAEPAEWQVLDQCCHITISRFFRDRGIFQALRTRVLPAMAARAQREQRAARVWSAGCASGEEAYTVKILWDLEVAKNYASVPVTIFATDIDREMLARAREGCFKPTSLHELPPHLIAQAFERKDSLFCVKPVHREGIAFAFEDLRSQTPSPLFDLILCRYVAFTYFAPALQQQVLGRLAGQLLPDGYLAIGTHERLPEGAALTPLSAAPQIFVKASAAA